MVSPNDARQWEEGRAAIYSFIYLHIWISIRLFRSDPYIHQSVHHSHYSVYYLDQVLYDDDRTQPFIISSKQHVVPYLPQCLQQRPWRLRQEGRGAGRGPGRCLRALIPLLGQASPSAGQPVLRSPRGEHGRGRSHTGCRGRRERCEKMEWLKNRSKTLQQLGHLAPCVKGWFVHEWEGRRERREIIKKGKKEYEQKKRGKIRKGRT